MSHQTGSFQENRNIIRYLYRGDLIKGVGEATVVRLEQQKEDTEVT